MKHFLKIGFIFALTIFLNCQTESYNKMEKLDNTIKKHFNSIQNRDLDKLLETIDKNSVTLILPNGKYSKTYAEYKKVNSEWFLDNDWKIEYEIIEKNVTEEMGIILTKITYFDKDENGKDYSFQYFLNLIFKLNQNEWKLVFDQNTIIK